jgi:long-chain acyl-CoA synthetase
MPLAFVYASYEELVPCIQACGTVVLLDSFSPRKAMEAIQKHHVTLMEGVPTMYAMMLNFPDANKYDISSLRYVVSAGAVLSAKLAAAFREKFGISIVDFYALNEALSLVGYDVSEKIDTKPFSCGYPFPGVEVKIFDDNDNEVPTGVTGELVTRSPSLLNEYFKDPETTSRALRGGWFHTGDLAKYDEGGYLYIVGRKKDLIIRGGANIFPSEVEEILYTNPKVAEAAVVGTPDEIFGEQVRAVLVLKKGATATIEEIREFCSKGLAEYKIPKYVEIWDELPKGPTGKILKRAIQEMPPK